MKAVVFAARKDHFQQKADELVSLGFSPADVVFADSSRVSRRHIINENLSQWLLFLDHDCSLNAASLAHLRRYIESVGSQMRVVAGRYIDPKQVSLVQRAHNFIANHWMLQSFHDANEYRLFLGGAFLIRVNREIPEIDDGFWGAEDKQLAYQLHDLGCEIQYDPDFVVVHETSRRIGHFFRRAYLHGKNDVQKLRANHNPINFSYWRKNIDYADPGLVALILLHFCVQKAAVLIQKVLRPNK